MKGGAGDDGFVFNSTGNLTGGTAAHILDFELDGDWVGLNFFSYYPYFPADLAFDPMTTTRKDLEATVLIDDADQLVFTTQVDDPFYSGEIISTTVTYDRNSGLLSATNTTNGHVDELAWITGAPDLTINHFYGMTTVAESGISTPYDSFPQPAAILGDIGLDLG